MLENFAGRADTPAKKREVMQRLQRAWRRIPGLRLGQLFVYAMGHDKIAFYYAEDFDLIERVEQYADSIAAKKNEDSQ